jgi:hypothetical protein
MCLHLPKLCQLSEASEEPHSDCCRINALLHLRSCDLLEVVDKLGYTCIELCSQAPLLCLSYSKQLLSATALLCNIRSLDPCDFWVFLLLPSSASATVITELRTRLCFE